METEILEPLFPPRTSNPSLASRSPGRLEAARRGQGRAYRPQPAGEAETQPRRSLAAVRRCALSQSALWGAVPSRLTWRQRRCPAQWRREPQSTCGFAEVLPYSSPAKLRGTQPDPTSARPAMGPPSRSVSALLLLLQVRRVPWFCGGRLPAPPSRARPRSSLSSRPHFFQESLGPGMAWKLRRALGSTEVGVGAGAGGERVALPTPSRKY